MQHSADQPKASVFRPLPNSVYVAVCFLAGIQLASRVSVPPVVTISATAAVAILVLLIHRQASSFARAAALLLVLCLGFCRWQLAQPAHTTPMLHSLCSDEPVQVDVTAQIVSIPFLHNKPVTEFAPRLYGPPYQTRFIANVSHVAIGEASHTIEGACQVYVSGDATARLSGGDTVELSGRLSWPKVPGNPGEFDYRNYLEGRHIYGQLFVDHPTKATVVSVAGVLDPRRLFTALRKEAQRTLTLNVAPEVRGVAMALLLGSRNQIPAEIEHSFVASGTMHLLAISGLHVGILCAFLMQTMHVLLVRRKTALLITLLVCAAYALITDLRPSVVRATLFFMIFVLGQFSDRNHRMPSLLSVTALVMQIWRPANAFNVGAWLSFLAVAALGWEASRQTKNNEAEVPSDATTYGGRARQWLSNAAAKLKFRYRQMLYILAFTTPLVASTFHVVSFVGLLVNVILIPFAALILCVGFLTLATGLLAPAAAFVPGTLFSTLLSFLIDAVEASSNIGVGHFFIPDLPQWFLPLYYVLLASALVIQYSPVRKMCVGGMILSATAALISLHIQTDRDHLDCTVLDVGQGNATIIEFPTGEIVLVDAGARSRDNRTAEIVCRFLWNQGHRRLKCVAISHADTNHINGLPGIIERIPIDEIVVPPEFPDSGLASARALMQTIRKHQIPLRICSNGDQIRIGSNTVHIHQASNKRQQQSDNERSLVFTLEHSGRTLVLPGDIEHTAAKQVLTKLAPCDVLISSNSGAKKANKPAVVSALEPRCVIVSAQYAKNREYLQAAYPTAEQILFTCNTGAVTVRIADDSAMQIHGHRNTQTLPQTTRYPAKQ